jgi:hypothetical protein
MQNRLLPMPEYGGNERLNKPAAGRIPAEERDYWQA